MEMINDILILTSKDLRKEAEDTNIEDLTVYDFKGSPPPYAGMYLFNESSYIIYKDERGINILKNRAPVYCNNEKIW